jgi:hypothetical protein
MNVDQASVFLIGTLLVGLGVSVIGIVILFLNNMYAKYWKPVTWSNILPEALRMPPSRFVEPSLDDTKGTKTK